MSPVYFDIALIIRFSAADGKSLNERMLLHEVILQRLNGNELIVTVFRHLPIGTRSDKSLLLQVFRPWTRHGLTLKRFRCSLTSGFEASAFGVTSLLFVPGRYILLTG